MAEERRVFWTDDGKEYCDEELALARLLEADVLHSNSRQYAELDWVPKPGVTIPSDGVPMKDIGDFYDFVPGKLQPETVVLFVGCNDVFYWGCADSESLPHAEIGNLYKMWEQDKAWGPTRWCCLRRGMRPQHPVMKAMREAGAWTSDLQALPPRSGAESCLAGCCKDDTEPRL